MSLLSRWSTVASSTHGARPALRCRLSLPNTNIRQQSSFSAVWRGLRTERSGRREPGSSGRGRSSGSRSSDLPAARRPSRPRDGGGPNGKVDLAASSLGGGRTHYKPKKALQKMREREEMDTEGGRKTRSKRFNNPEYSFGKKSLVYQLNKGDFQDKISKLVDAKRTGSSTAAGTSERKDVRREEDPWKRMSSSTDDRQQARSRRGASGDRRPRNAQPCPARDAARSEGPRGDDGAFRRMRSTSDYTPRERGSPAAGRSFGHSDVTKQRARDELREEDDDAFSHRPAFKGRTNNFAATLPQSTAASQFLFGRWPVAAALEGGAGAGCTTSYVYCRAANREERPTIPVRQRLGQESHGVRRGRPHNGLVLEVSPLPQLPLVSLGPVTEDGYTVEIAHQMREDAEINGTEPFQAWDSRAGHKPFVLLLHEVMDPGNLGAMLRTARFLGAAAVVITKQTSSPITPTVVKAAAGAAEELAIFSVADPVAFLEGSQKAGWESYVAVAPASGSSNSARQQVTADELAEEDPLREKPCILVLGNEGEGLSRKIMSRASRQVTIQRQPAGRSSVDSLNVSVAAALLCDAFTKGARAVPRSFQQKLKLDEKRARGGESLF
ncbi:rRNA methyltransferase [Verticillium alfalfae VaMs.102]|uniref:rRNA methyltransferase n=1 Tax=Verticillium alfalfae (strain VaMs.102 / ATCC MYA-4576 / FGSC 10136) TaxID=526221 RepID=C9S5N8_VERA1|nr:rRNA methyltransferase [Verticillium alfalfae VaMs.102]EEY14264.1 rRNA methyltransferase [Verticillium alfalfae VaMs.102]